MKNLLGLFGLVGMIIGILILLGIYTSYGSLTIYVLAGLILMGLIYIVLSVVQNVQRNKRIKKIIASPKKRSDISSSKKEHASKKASSGWTGMSLRERKSGLTWGGGNIHGANAKRGTKKSFLK